MKIGVRRRGQTWERVKRIKSKWEVLGLVTLTKCW
jgi:hypothetical protein